jgi:hypothetical protein
MKATEGWEGKGGWRYFAVTMAKHSSVSQNQKFIFLGGGGGRMHASFWWGSLKEIDHLENAGVSRKLILQWSLKKQGSRSWIELIWRRTENTVMQLRI